MHIGNRPVETMKENEWPRFALPHWLDAAAQNRALREANLQCSKCQIKRLTSNILEMLSILFKSHRDLKQFMFCHYKVKKMQQG